MTEEKVKKRGWVKNAAIIFLAVMLLLTFFSNTFMNYSLPEVAAQYVQSGSINAKIRGSGQVTANESFEVKSSQSRKVDSVPVKVGSKVEIGDTLLYFADAESEDIKTAQNELDELELAYQLKLVDLGNGQYAKETRAVEQARAALDKAKADMEANFVSKDAIKQAEAAVDSADIAVTKQTDLIAELEAQYGTGTGDLETAKKELQSVMLVYGTWYNKLVEETNDWMKKNNITGSKEQDEQRGVYMAALVERYKLLLSSSTFSFGGATEKLADAENGNDETVSLFATMQVSPRWVDDDSMDKMVKAYAAVNPKKTAVDKAEKASGITEAKSKLVELKRTKSDCEQALTDIKAKRTEYETLESGIYAKRDALDTALNALADAQKTDQKTDIQLQADREKIEKKREALADLKAGGSGAALKSEVAGIVKTIEVTAGKTTEKNTTLMTIEVPEKGYGVSFPVSIEKSKKVKVGDTAEITGGYWGSNITATLVGIKTDPQNPSTNKILRFKLSGDVESGSTVSVAIGERSGNYDCIIPTSAIRSDNNGSFVLAVISKSSPLGNRFMAQRIDVKVEASDDTNSAVSGGLSYSDMVITTSSKPLESGMLVRMAE